MGPLITGGLVFLQKKFDSKGQSFTYQSGGNLMDIRLFPAQLHSEVINDHTLRYEDVRDYLNPILSLIIAGNRKRASVLRESAPKDVNDAIQQFIEGFDVWVRSLNE